MSNPIERGAIVSLGGLLTGGGLTVLGFVWTAITVLVASSAWSLYQYRRTTDE